MFYRCPKCQELFAADTVPLAKCAACGVLLRVQPVELPPETPLPPADKLVIAWEGEGPLLARFATTLQQLARSAPQFFFSLEDQSPRRAERFAYVCSLIGLLGYFAVQLWIYQPGSSELSRLVELIGRATDRAPRPDQIRKVLAWGFALSPILAALPAHVAAGLYQLGLWFFRSNRREYDVTFRVAAYGLAPMVLLGIPGIGPLLAPGWIFALHWTGLAASHRIPLLVSLLAILMPLLTLGLLLLRAVSQLLILALTQ